MPISLYSTTVKTEGWYLKILFHCVDISKVNTWLLYHRHCNQLQVLQKNQMFLLVLMSKIAEGSGSANKVPRGAGRPSKRKSTDDVAAVKHKSSKPPCNDVRYDGMHNMNNRLTRIWH